MRSSYSKISHLHQILGCRVRMVRCTEDEPDPPTEVHEFEMWCESGSSGIPIQKHIGHYGIIQRVETEEALLVLFDDGDERMLYVDEVRLLRHGVEQ